MANILKYAFLGLAGGTAGGILAGTILENAFMGMLIGACGGLMLGIAGGLVLDLLARYRSRK